MQRVAAPVEAQMQAWLDGSWESGLPRTVADEPRRVAKLRALGNAIVPQVAYMILQNIVDIESLMEETNA